MSESLVLDRSQTDPSTMEPVRTGPGRTEPGQTEPDRVGAPSTPHGEYCRIAPDVRLGEGVRIFAFVNLYGCTIGDHSKIGTFVEIQKNAVIGQNVKISSHSFICEGVTIEDEVFIGHSVCFINDKYPRGTNADGSLQTEADWQVVPTVVKRGASIGTGSTILCGVTIGEGAMVGAGSVVLRDVPAHTVVAGNPARFLKTVGQ